MIDLFRSLWERFVAWLHTFDSAPTTGDEPTEVNPPVEPIPDEPEPRF